MRMQILQVIFGQELPDTATSFAQQAFAVSVAAIGLAAFALVLALVEQVRQAPSQVNTTESHGHTQQKAWLWLSRCNHRSGKALSRISRQPATEGYALIQQAQRTRCVRCVADHHCCRCDRGLPMQVVLQVVDENVARGSKVFETGHVRMLVACDLQSFPTS